MYDSDITRTYRIDYLDEDGFFGNEVVQVKDSERTAFKIKLEQRRQGERAGWYWRMTEI